MGSSEAPSFPHLSKGHVCLDIVFWGVQYARSRIFSCISFHLNSWEVGCTEARRVFYWLYAMPLLLDSSVRYMSGYENCVLPCQKITWQDLQLERNAGCSTASFGKFRYRNAVGWQWPPFSLWPIRGVMRT